MNTATNAMNSMQRTLTALSQQEDVYKRQDLGRPNGGQGKWGF